MKSHKIANNSATTEAREEISADLESLELKKIFDVCLNKFENNQILLNKISHRFQATTPLFSGWKSIITSWLNEVRPIDIRPNDVVSFFTWWREF